MARDPMILAVAVAVAASVGAVARYLVEAALARRTVAAWPVGTFVVNLTGSFALGVLVGLTLDRGVGGSAHAVLGSGFVGAYTTFSTFSYETVRLVERGAYRHAVVNVAVSLLGGLMAAAAGLLLASVVTG